MTEYLHTVQYYETDKMGITHHSNYIRWMEEARVDYLNQIGWPYERLEASGIQSPVIGVDCKYKAPTTFPDQVRIRVSVEAFDGLRLRFRYEMRKDDRVVLEAHSEHCFLDTNGKILRVKRDYPELYELLAGFAAETASFPAAKRSCL